MTVEQMKVNPYDWKHEVTEPELFAGRREELASIEEQVTGLVAARPIAPMVAVIGERRVGKTSLLLRVEEMCSNYRLLATRVSLTNTTATDVWEFWREVFDGIIRAANRAGVLAYSSDRGDFGFLRQSSDERNQARKYGDRLQFPVAYMARSSLSVVVPPSHILQEDLQLLCECVQAGGYQGILLMLDEAHLLAGSDEIKQQLRHAVRESGKCGVVFAGEPQLGQMFSDPSEPLFAQALVISLENFINKSDVVECALLPLSEDEYPLMSPMTIDYLARLSRGKPNQIRLICNSIYKRYQKNEQEDLNITINVLEDVVDNIASAYTEYDLRRQVDKIRRLSSVDLEILYNMTRYPDWSVEDIVNLDESFRGEADSQISVSRRARILAEKRDKFIRMGLMADVPYRYILVGGEFIYLYVRFWYEIRKYGDLSRRLVLGKGSPTPFGEKAEKLVRSLAWELGRSAEIVMFNWLRHDMGLGDVAARLRRRFSVLDDLLKGVRLPVEDVEGTLSECLTICELVSKPGAYHLLCLSLRNLENPRELMQIEMYFGSGEMPLVIPLSTLQLIHRQADYAKILMEDSDNFGVTLPDLPSLLEAIGAPALEEIMTHLGIVERWRLASVQHLVQTREEPTDSERGEDKVTDEEKTDEWLRLYEKGDLNRAEECLSQKLLEPSESHKSARLYNDRGYISYGLKKVDRAKKDLQRALDLHYEHLTLTLLNLSVIDIDESDYGSALQRIEDALLLTFGREDIKASYLRLRLLPSHLAIAGREKWEQRPANILEASYINLAYALARSGDTQVAMDALQEGLTLIPSSVRLKHALARLQLFKMRANLADPVYEELSQASITDGDLNQEIRLYVQRFRRKTPKRVNKRI